MSLYDPNDVYDVTLNLLCIGMLISTSELLSIHKEFSKGGMFSWAIFREKRGILQRSRHLGLIELSDKLFSHDGVIGILLVRLVSILLVVVSPIESVSFFLSLSVLLSTQLLLNFRLIYGGDGADQMTTIVLLALWVPLCAGGSDQVKTFGVLFIAAQALLAYTASGLAKTMSEIWRSGSAISKVMNHDTYGNRFLAGVLEKNPALSSMSCWVVIFFQISFVLFLLIPSPFNYVYLAFGVLFHFSIALAMGLGGFFFSFIATYPALIFANSFVHERLF